MSDIHDDSYRLAVKIAAQLPEETLRSLLQDLIEYVQQMDDPSNQLRDLAQRAKRFLAEEKR